MAHTWSVEDNLIVLGNVYFWRHNLLMKACCVHYGGALWKGCLNLRVKRIIPMLHFWSVLVYRHWLLPVNSPCISENTCFSREVMIAQLLGSISVPVFTNIIQDTVRK